MGISRRLVSSVASAVLLSACALPNLVSDAPEDFFYGETATGSVYANFLSARYAALVNDHDDAADYYARALEKTPGDPETLDRAVLSSLIIDDRDAASALAGGAAIETLTQAPFAALTRVSRDIGRRSHGRARETLNKLEPGTIPLVEQVLMVWLTAQRSPKAGMKLAQAIDLGSLASCHAAMLSAQVEGEKDAIEAFETLDVTCLRSPIIAARYLTLLEAHGDHDKALAVAEALSPAVREDPEVRMILADGTARKATRRSQTLEQAIARDAYLAAMDSGATRNSQIATVILQWVLLIDPGMDRVRIDLAQSHFDLKRYDAALHHARSVGTGSPFYAAAEWEQVRALMALERRDEALVIVQAMVAREQNWDMSLRLADSLRALDRPFEAEAMYSRLLASDAPQVGMDWRALFGRAVVLNQLERWSEAEADLLAGLEIDPNQPDILNFLGYGWVDRGENVEAGFDLIRKALNHRPGSGYIIDSLGWAHFQLGQFNDAILHLERAVEVTPGDPEITHHLGDAYWQAGRKLEAEFEWRRALDYKPTEADRISLEKKLVSGLDGPGIAQNVEQGLP